MGENSFGKAMPPEMRRMTHTAPGILRLHSVHQSQEVTRGAAALSVEAQQGTRLRAARPCDDLCRAHAGAAEGGCGRVSVGVPNESGHVATMRRAVCWMGRGCPCGGVSNGEVCPGLRILPFLFCSTTQGFLLFYLSPDSPS